MYHKSLGRVHWFLWHLDKSIKRDYKIYFDYACHSYTLIRYSIRIPYDLFVVVRTSKRCFRVVYSCVRSNQMIYKSFSTSKLCADFIKFIYDRSFPLIQYKPP